MSSKTLQDAQKMREAMRLKFTYRFWWRMQWEQESVAAHSWSMMLVADYLLAKLEELAPWKYILDTAKVYSLIAYHDLIEAETGDEDVDPSNQENHKQKNENEKAAFHSFQEKLPTEIQKKFEDMYSEYEERKTIESRFVKIVDCIEAEFFCHEMWELFTTWTKDFHEELRLKHFRHFPELTPLIEDIIRDCDEKYYRKKSKLC